MILSVKRCDEDERLEGPESKHVLIFTVRSNLTSLLPGKQWIRIHVIVMRLPVCHCYFTRSVLSRIEANRVIRNRTETNESI